MPLSLWSGEAPTVVLGDSRDAEGLPLPVAPSPTTLFGPRGACLVAEQGPLWVADTGHHRLLGWRRRPLVDSTPADWVIGQPDFHSESRNARTAPGAATLNVPTGIVAYRGGLAVADAWNHRVLIWHRVPQHSHCAPDLVLGQECFGEAAINRGRSIPGADTLYWPYGVGSWGDALLVADTGNRRVLIWERAPQCNGQPADLVLGQKSFESRDENAGGEPNSMSMRWPHAVVCWEGMLCAADAGNNRLMIWRERPVVSGVDCDWILGQQDSTGVDHNAGRYWPQADTLNMPYGIAGLGPWLLAADTANSRLVGWHRSRLVSGADADLLAGQWSFSVKGDNRWAFPMRDSLCWPYGLSVCGTSIAVADSGNNRILLGEIQRTLLP